MTATAAAPIAYDPYDPRLLDDPYPAYRQLRDHDPVHRHAGQHGGDDFYVLSRFADIWAAVRRPELFSSAHGITFRNEIAELGLAPTIVMLDPPLHTRLRSLIGAAFTPRRVAALEDELRTFVGTRIDRLERKTADGEQADLHRDFSSPIPTFVLGSLLGIPESDRDRFDPWVSGLTRLQNAGFAIDGIGDATAAVADMYAYFTEVIAARRADPQDDLLGALVAAEIDGQRLTDWDILGFCFVMVAGGNDTTGNLISHGVMLLDDDHAARERLVDQPDLIERALVEFLRLESSVQGLARMTTAPVSVRDIDIPAGDEGDDAVRLSQSRRTRIRGRRRAAEHRPRRTPSPCVLERRALLHRLAPRPAAGASGVRGVAPAAAAHRGRPAARAAPALVVHPRLGVAAGHRNCPHLTREPDRLGRP